MSNMQVFTPKNMAPQLTVLLKNTTNVLDCLEGDEEFLSGAKTAWPALN